MSVLIMIRNRDELQAYLRRHGYRASRYRIAVEAIIFDLHDRILLEERGEAARDEIGKLEAAGGELEDNEHDLHAALHRELREEFGEDLIVRIERLLEVRSIEVDEPSRGLQKWLVVSYLCRLLEGEARPVERGKVRDVRSFRLDEFYTIPEHLLSASTNRARLLYRALYRDRPYYACPAPGTKEATD